MGALHKALDWPVKGVIVKSAEIDFVDVVDNKKLIHLHLQLQEITCRPMQVGRY